MTPENYCAWISGYFDLSATLSDFDIRLKEKLNKLSPIDFCYFLSGYFECSNYILNYEQIIMRDHLKLVFEKVTPVLEKNDNKSKLEKLIEDTKVPFDITHTQQFPLHYYTYFNENNPLPKATC